jgi:hypothetical protein
MPWGNLIVPNHRRFPYLLFGLAALCLLSSVAQAKTDLIEPPRELQIDPATLTVDGKTYHRADVVVRALLRRPATTRTEEDRTIDLHGFSVIVPKGTVLTERAFIRAPNPRMFSKADGVGTPSKGAVFCNDDRFALGPFTSGDNLTPFKALACLIDGDRDGAFEAVTFIGFFSAREVGPVPLTPLAYRAVPGAFVPGDHVDLVFNRFSGKYIYLKPILYDSEGKHGSIRMYTDERGSLLTSYSDGCLINAPSDAAAPSTVLGATLTVSNADPVAQSFSASIMPKAMATPLTAQVSNYQLITDWVPYSLARCGDKQDR